MTKRTHGEMEDAGRLEEISLLFIPFDAAKKFYKANVTHGVKGLEGSINAQGLPTDGSRLKNALVPEASKNPFAHFIECADIGKNLSKIVQQECDLIRNLRHPDSDYDSILSAVLEGSAQQDHYSDWSDKKKKRLDRVLKGYKHYPTFVFLSENPTGAPFPARIETGIPEMGYLRKHVIDKLQIKGLRPVNEMAVYLREDINRQLGGPADDALFLKTETITRSTKGLPVKAKDEYILKVTMGRKNGFLFTVAGVHLRASLVSSSKQSRQQEREALQRFCESQEIQIMVGDFNMDLQETTLGSRGIYFDKTLESQPRFALAKDSTVAIPFFVQQYSNSVGTSHFMGYLKADEETLELSGPSMYGHMGVSGSRHLRDGEGYYSDHPSIYLCARSTRLTAEARNKILQRKIIKAPRK